MARRTVAGQTSRVACESWFNSSSMKTISSTDDLADLVKQSNEQPVLIFKHSNACPVSARALGEVQRLLDGVEDADFGFGMVVVQQARSVSNDIAERFGIRHESPQAIVLRNEKPVWNASHWNVTRDKLTEALREA